MGFLKTPTVPGSKRKKKNYTCQITISDPFQFKLKKRKRIPSGRFTGWGISSSFKVTKACQPARLRVLAGPGGTGLPRPPAPAPCFPCWPRPQDAPSLGSIKLRSSVLPTQAGSVRSPKVQGDSELVLDHGLSQQQPT